MRTEKSLYYFNLGPIWLNALCLKQLVKVLLWYNIPTHGMPDLDEMYLGLWEQCFNAWKNLAQHVPPVCMDFTGTPARCICLCSLHNFARLWHAAFQLSDVAQWQSARLINMRLWVRLPPWSGWFFIVENNWSNVKLQDVKHACHSQIANCTLLCVTVRLCTYIYVKVPTLFQTE